MSVRFARPAAVRLWEAATSWGSERAAGVQKEPRVSYRIGNALVGCHTTHIAIHPSIGDGPGGATALADHGVAPCEHLVWDGAKIVVSASRASDDGGVATWSLPTNTNGSFDPVVFVDRTTTPGGIGGIALHEGILYAARLPNRVATFEVAADGKLTELADIVVPELLEVAEVTLSGEVLVVSDPNGRVFTLDVAWPAPPQPAGWTLTAGVSTGLATLPDHVVAVANGSAGIELIDIANSLNPSSRLVVATPGVVQAVSYHDGYLAAADGEFIWLYDASESGGLRLLDAHELGGLARPTGVRLDEHGFIAVDPEHIYTGSLTPGARAPRMVLHRTTGDYGVGIRFSNGGRETLWVKGVEPEQVVALAPFETGFIPAAASTLVTLETNDPEVPSRSVSVDEGE